MSNAGIVCCSDDMEIAVVYFRSGYAPDHFKTQQVSIETMMHSLCLGYSGVARILVWGGPMYPLLYMI